MLISLDASPRKNAEGYVCELCMTEQPQVFASRPALWQDHLFEPFLAWVNTALYPATGLVLSGGINQGFTAAKLVAESHLTTNCFHVHC